MRRDPMSSLFSKLPKPPFGKGPAGNSDMARDLSTLANGAASVLGDVRQEVKTMMQGQSERRLNAADMATREELDAALTRIEALAQRIAVLEAQLEAQNSPKKPAKKAAAKKTSS
ncbi:MAG: accessory factor UbiK family protein [Candidatus Puniceispirillaceae bacterium]